ncbi:MAG: hypothetical protein ACFCUV_25350 [Rivularia sp. (in: cyanobacteria)]
MAKTPVDLYRRGSANSPKMDNVRPDKDVAVYEDNNEIWVMETLREQSSGGISTFAKLGKGKNWWKLNAFTDIPAELELINDHGYHWLWKPSQNMPISKYKDALKLIGESFTKVS